MFEAISLHSNNNNHNNNNNNNYHNKEAEPPDVVGGRTVVEVRVLKGETFKCFV
jgi:hypothetical protein